MTQAIAERGFGRGDADVHSASGRRRYAIRQRLPIGESGLLEVGQELNVHCWMSRVPSPRSL
jgi:hypothetical protein